MAQAEWNRDETEKSPPMKIISNIAGPFTSWNITKYESKQSKKIDTIALNLYSLNFVLSYIRVNY